MSGRRGKPLRAEAPSCVFVKFRLSPEERARLDVVARENGLGVSVVVREAVNDYVADYAERKVFQRTA